VRDLRQARDRSRRREDVFASMPLPAYEARTRRRREEMNQLPRNEVLAGLTVVARPIMLDGHVRPDSCIAMTAVAVEVMRYFGYDANPLNVEVLIVNRAWREALERGEFDPTVKLPDALFEAGAYGLGLGVESQRLEKLARGEEAGGHVVAVVDRYLVDLSLDQASRPQHGIDLAPRIFEFDGVVTPEERAWTYALNDGACFVEYKLRPDIQTWRDSPDWRFCKKRYADQIGRIIRRIKEGDHDHGTAES
jgi:hypothetical protein